METTPGAVAKLIADGAVANGARVTYIDADDEGRFGLMRIQMPDGEVVQIQIELS